MFDKSSSNAALTDSQVITRNSFYFLVFCGGCTLAFFAVWLDIHVLKDKMQEISVTEISQEIILAICAINYWILAIKSPERRGALILIAGYFSCMEFRELDALFDHIHHGAWKYIVGACAIGSILTAIKCQGTVEKPLADYLKSRTFMVTACGMAILMIFSRLYGMGSFWHDVLEDGFARRAKELSEEGVELLGYVFILMGSLPHIISEYRRLR